MGGLRIALLAAGAAVAWLAGAPDQTVVTEAASAVATCAGHDCGCPADGCADNCCCAGQPADAPPTAAGEARLARGFCRGAQPDDEAAPPAPIAAALPFAGEDPGADPPAPSPAIASSRRNGHAPSPAHGPPRGAFPVSAA